MPMLLINVLREISRLHPTHAAALDSWQQGFIKDQLQRFEKFGDDTHISQKQAAALEKALSAMQKQGGEQS